MTEESLRHRLFFCFSVSLPKNNYLANLNSNFHSSWKDLLAFNNRNIICTLVHLFSNETKRWPRNNEGFSIFSISVSFCSFDLVLVFEKLAIQFSRKIVVFIISNNFSRLVTSDIVDWCKTSNFQT